MKRPASLVRRRGRPASKGSDASAPARLRQAQPGKLLAIDHACAHLRLRSFADLGGIGQVYGEYSYYTMAKPGIRRGILVDLKITEWVLQRARSHRGLRVIHGNFLGDDVRRQIGSVDAILLFDVLLHTVDPDWDQVLELFAESTRCFIIANPQWERSTRTVRLLELGREAFLEAVPPTKNHEEVFDHLDEHFEEFGRPYRDAMHIWQWGITYEDLVAKMESLGFEMEYYARLNPFWETRGFVNTAFVFARR